MKKDQTMSSVGEEMEKTPVNEFEVYFRDDENVLKLNVIMFAQLCECTKPLMSGIL